MMVQEANTFRARIAARIREEYTKHPTLDWADIAAAKIVAAFCSKEELGVAAQEPPPGQCCKSSPEAGCGLSANVPNAEEHPMKPKA